MNNGLSVLLTGLGSIGTRHLKNLCAHSPVKNIFLLTKNKNCLKDINTRNKHVSFVRSIREAGPVDFAIVSNETSKHLEAAFKLARGGINLFIEKPLSHSLKNTEKLRETAARKKITVFIGYNMRFLKALRRVKRIVGNNTLGKLHFARIEAGQYLPDWRPGRDYSKCYSSRKNLGGGVSLDLSHEIDYMTYLFGKPFAWKVIKAKVSDLRINSDDIFEGIYAFSNGFICSVHLDYLQKTKKRRLFIAGSKGTLLCDFIAKRLVIRRNGKEKLLGGLELFDMDKTYIEELRHFIDAVQKRKTPQITIKDGINVLKLLEN